MRQPIAYFLSLLLLMVTPYSSGQAKPLRVVSLSPSLTDMMIELDSTDLLVGILDAGKRPDQVAHVESVGQYLKLSLEKLISLKPDLILMWPTSITQSEHQQITGLGFKILEISPQTIQQLAEQSQYLGQQLGRPEQGKRLAQQIETEASRLKQQYNQTEPIKVFYQVWDKPLYTIGKSQIITDALTLCGAKNIFDNINIPAPNVNLESVIAQKPKVIIVPDEQQLTLWENIRQLKSLKDTHFIIFNNENISRTNVAMLAATRELCQKLDAIK